MPRLAALSATMRLATEPSRVRLPARVEAAARVSQPAVGSARCATAGRSSNSFFFLLEARLDMMTVMSESPAAPFWRNGARAAKMPSVR
jgi:hypothetical protein